MTDKDFSRLEEKLNDLCRKLDGDRNANNIKMLDLKTEIVKLQTVMPERREQELLRNASLTEKLTGSINELKVDIESLKNKHNKLTNALIGVIVSVGGGIALIAFKVIFNV